MFYFLLYNLEINILDVNKFVILGKIYFDKMYKTMAIILKVNTTSFKK